MVTKAKIRRFVSFLVVTSAVSVAVGMASDRLLADENNGLAPWQTPPRQQKVSGEGVVADGSIEGNDSGVSSDCSSCGPTNDCAACGDGYERPGGVALLLERRDQLWFRGDYLLAWRKSSNLPTLATSGTAPTAPVLFGGPVDPGATSGFRATLGYQFWPCERSGMEITYMGFASASVNYDASSDSSGSPTIARPFYNISQTGSAYAMGHDTLLVALAGQQAGDISVDLNNRLDSLEVLFREGVFDRPGQQVDFLFGYRFGQFAENLSVEDTTTFTRTVGQVTAGTVMNFWDRFSATNRFHGVDLGVASKSRYGCFTMELLGKMAVGYTRSSVNINGATIVTAPGDTPDSSDGGLLAQLSNMGTHDRDSFSVMPEFGVSLGYDITCNLRATVGYTVLYWNNVLRTADQIDTNINTTQTRHGTLAGIALPVTNGVLTDFWVQSLTFGVDYRF
jgi:hypothetical protein